VEEASFSEFRPPDDSMIEYMLNLSASLTLISNRDELAENDSQILKRAAHSMRVLLAMAVSGHMLFAIEGKHADALANLCSTLYDNLLLSGVIDIEEFDISALNSFTTYREEGPNISDIPYFSGGDL
jgi:hypothetical protein